ncbi:hypothetical protein [Streptomyces sp. WAC07149]|uniref:hypothetical protein n=1 Tax=Streptomyces sp. WAC07149 TaxID=2487425 RepID=UPI00163B9157|nr:hypothetical protein [Streptomyces sp. WAC07149]
MARWTAVDEAERDQLLDVAAAAARWSSHAKVDRPREHDPPKAFSSTSAASTGL